jgi:hypothetical protein
MKRIDGKEGERQGRRKRRARTERRKIPRYTDSVRID